MFHFEMQSGKNGTQNNAISEAVGLFVQPSFDIIDNRGDSMAKWVKVSLGVFGLVVALLLIIQFNAFIFVQGPNYKDLDDDKKIHSQLLQQVNATEGTLLNRYALNEVTYISEGKISGARWLFWYDQDLNIKQRRRVDSWDENSAKQAGEKLGWNSKGSLNFGWINSKPAVLLTDEKREILLDFDTLECLMNYEKR